MVQLAFSTNAYTRFDLPEAIRRIADHGYDGVEILADVPHAFLADFDERDRERVLTALDETGLSVSNVNANTTRGYYDDAPPSAFFDPTLISGDEEDRRWRIDYTKAALDFAALVGAPAACVASGSALPGTPPDEAYDHLLDSLDELTDYAERVGVDLGIEFEPELLVEDTEEVLTLIDDVGSDALGVNFDVGHAAVCGEDPAESIRQCAGRITGVHLEDIAGGRGGKHYHLVPGEGDIEFEPVFGALDDIGYDGFATFELYTYPDDPDDAARRARDELADYVR
ncbi:MULTISPECIES: sugar phosphate isomerase/epimerase [unclassified Haloferax]|uniref:sugar phosphate isomerase/epimerase family protein n=1 Tax=Haloferax TaxID=2251 RepID=UPI000E280937|nr:MULTISPECIES: sugar phosphate isomerase/epimerase family protein [unclassified Haloferax]RDZ33875.1 sugar phosphate isomerase/epimerase [Haloferax sp. Atlit-24N]RLM36259.1 sugar phosphate isomerase/epimerase [Haloferax sp. Atlit-109R]RLM41535.1 sugar phosphate isomerase/epimerase [Haloferax sp. Atlit-105R]